MIILYSSNPEITQTWQKILPSEKTCVCHYEKALLSLLDSLHVNVILLVEDKQYNEEGIEGFLELIRDKYPLLRTVVLSSKPTYAQGSALLKYGIKAYGNVHMSPVYLKEAIDVVKNGNVWLYPDFIQTMILTLSSQKKALHTNHELLNKLSLKEKEVALLIKEGLSNKEIALREGTTERTVKAHLSSIYEKMGIKDRLALALLI